jgi:hypothetical protein
MSSRPVGVQTVMQQTNSQLVESAVRSVGGATLLPRGGGSMH